MLRRLSRGVVLLLAFGSTVCLEVFVLDNGSGERVGVSNAVVTEELPPCQPGDDHAQTIKCLRPKGDYIVLPSRIHSGQEEDEEPPFTQHLAHAPHSVFDAAEQPITEEHLVGSSAANPEPIAILGSTRISRKDVKTALIPLFVVLTGCIGAASIMSYLINSHRKRTLRERMQRGVKWVSDSHGWWENIEQRQKDQLRLESKVEKAEIGLDWGTFECGAIV